MASTWKKTFHSSLRYFLIICIGIISIPALEREWVPETGSTASPTASQLFSQSRFEPVDKNFLPSLEEFTAGLEMGDGNSLRGVYVPGILAIPVIPQPKGKPGYVSTENNKVTEFQSAADNNVIGLLAHNYLAGKDFFRLREGQQVLIVYGDGKANQYVVTGIYDYQKLDPGNMFSRYRNLTDGKRLSTRQLFNLVYSGPHHVTFQTCIARNGNLEWGLRFVIAEPVVYFK
jgi:hypothetical protein